eukprot:5689844-Pyramimonas_sp.AAC.1
MMTTAMPTAMIVTMMVLPTTAAKLTVPLVVLTMMIAPRRGKHAKMVMMMTVKMTTDMTTVRM